LFIIIITIIINGYRTIGNGLSARVRLVGWCIVRPTCHCESTSFATVILQHLWATGAVLSCTYKCTTLEVDTTVLAHNFAQLIPGVGGQIVRTRKFKQMK